MECFIFFVPADLVTFTEEILNGMLHFFVPADLVTFAGEIINEMLHFFCAVNKNLRAG